MFAVIEEITSKLLFIFLVTFILFFKNLEFASYINALDQDKCYSPSN